MKYLDMPHGNAALAVFPSVDGFGWIVFDGPLSPVAFGVSSVAKAARGADAKNTRCLKQFERLMRTYAPPTVVLEAFEGPGTKRHARITRLCRSVISASTMSGARIRILSREDIKKTFASTEPKTRYDVAALVASYLPEIRHKLPKLRKSWKPEAPNMALFAAAALLIAHYANPAEPL